ncbi:Mannitol dehydrogenase domain [[Clostridium] cellulosi]|uniref:Mannitol dehydrogenase domain n=1 Tax=[Clostridium] cellulosi TaxID=29343 RepID=A0A078KQ11_9FIRM|nr:Mannitol dehydrogenase domain [[Clostridium] cellulosi]
MVLNRESLKNSQIWEAAEISLPKFDIDKMRSNTARKPEWIHFGSGNIFRAFLAAVHQQLLEKNCAQTGIIAVEAFDYEIIEKVYKPNDELSLLVTLNSDGTMDKKVIASVADSIAADSENEREWEKLRKIAANPSLQMMSFTITEKGYNLFSSSGSFIADVAYDIIHGPAKPRSIITKVTSLLLARYHAGAYPVALVSMDNCSRNGDKLKSSVLTIAEQWVKNGFANRGFLSYLTNAKTVSFPCSMIDKITPRPSPVVQEHLKEINFESCEIIRTSKNTYISAFVNAEAPQYLVIEDIFPNGRPALDKAGVFFTDKETVEKAERMKLCTCLNPLHTSLAVFGCLLGYTSIASEMKNEALKKLVIGVGLKEGMPVVVDPGIINPAEFINEVIEKRLPNPFIPDTPQRIMSDTSQKIPNRFGNTIKLYRQSKELDAAALTYIPLVIAGWCRYLLGVDDNLETMELSYDPMLNELQGYLSSVRIGSTESVKDALKPILSNSDIFGVSLYEVNLAGKVEAFFKEMIAGKHAVQNVLEKVVL